MEDVMKNLKLMLFATILALPFLATSAAKAQVAVGVGVGPAVVDAPVEYGPPVCDWGYYPYYPYGCAPYGYYGPSWFSGGIFIGAGPWGFGHGWRGYSGGRGFGGRGYYGGGQAFSGRGGFRAGVGNGYSGRAFSGG